MYLFFGICGFLQAVFIPGFFLTSIVFRINSYSQFLPICFALSFICNYIIVITFVLLHCYTQITMIILFLSELICLMLLGKQKKLHFPSNFFSHIYHCKEDRIIPSFYLAGKFFLFIFLGFVLISLSKKAGGIFTSWDGVVSWNRWAVDWAANHLPRTTWHYPQLIPIAYSIPYVFMGKSIIQSFSFAICLLWLPMALLFLYNFYKEKNFSVLATSIGIYLWYTIVPIDYVDFPVCVLSLFSCIALLIWQTDNNYHNSTFLLLAIIFAFSAAATKQGGIVWLFFLPFAVWESCRFRPATLPLKKIIVLCSILFITVFSWYAFIRYQIAHGGGHSEISWVTQGIHEGRSYIERCARALQTWPSLGIVWAVAWLGLSVCGLRVITLMGLFYSLIWAMFFSYDIRNISPAIPFLLFAASEGLLTQTKIRCNITHIVDSILSLHKYLLPIIMGMICIFLSICLAKNDYINNWLIERQNRKILNIGSRECNLFLIKKIEEYPIPLITNYQFAGYLPQLNAYYNPFHFNAQTSQLGKEQLVQLIQMKSPCYIFMPTHWVTRWLSTFPKENLQNLGRVSSYSLFLVTKSDTP